MMKSRFGVALLLIALLTVVATQALAAKIVWEGESYSSITPSMTKVSSNGASGGAYIGIPLARPHGDTEGASRDQGRVVYKIRVPVAGTYQFWGRCWWQDGCGNSFYLRVGDKPPVVLGQDGSYQRWHWVKGPSITLRAGVVTIVLQNREDGAKLDQALLLTDRRYEPVRAERETPGASIH